MDDALNTVGDAEPVTALGLMRGVYGRLEEVLKGRADDFLEWVRIQIDTYAAAPEPYRPFDEMAEATTAATAEMYEPVGPGSDAFRGLPAVVVWQNTPPSSFSFARGVNAFLETIPGSPPQLVIKVCPKSFDRDSALALPYVLFHEYVCHVARLLAHGDLRSGPGSPFAEGWMDYVALELHNDAVRRSWSARRVWLDPSGHVDAARRLHALRHDRADRDDQIGNGRGFGRDTAHRFDCRFPTRRLTGPIGRVSTLLNASELDDVALDGFVRDVARALDAEPTAIRLGRLVRNPGLTPQELVEQVANLT